MARKPLEQLSPAYRRRVERAEAKGLSRQAARGHKPKEHIIRKEREQIKRQALVKSGKKPGLTSSQKQAIKRFVEKQDRKKVGKTSPDTVAKTRARMERQGWQRFQEIRAIVAINQKAYKREKRPLFTAEEWDDMMEDVEDDMPDYIFYYH